MTDREFKMIGQILDRDFGHRPEWHALLEEHRGGDAFAVKHWITTAHNREHQADLAVARVLAARPCTTTWRRWNPAKGPHWIAVLGEKIRAARILRKLATA
jgi:hypothetical protein